MNKEEFFKEVLKNKLIPEGELNKLYDEWQEVYKEKGLEGEELEKAIINIVQGKLKQRNRINAQAKEFEAMIIDEGNITDWGAQNKYTQAIQLYSSDPEMAVEQGFTNEEGQPIFQSPEFKKGKLIEPIKEKIKQMKVICKQLDDSEWKRGNYKLRFNQLYDESAEGNLTEKQLQIPTFCKVKFKANVTSKTTDDFYDLIAINEMEQIGPMPDTTEEVLSSIKEFYSDNVITTLSTLRDWVETQEERYPFVTLVGTAVGVRKIDDETKSDIIELNGDDLDFNMDEENSSLITCWTPKEIINQSHIIEGAIGIILTGVASINNDGNLSVNAHNIYVPKKYRNGIGEDGVEKPKEVNVDENAINAAES